MITEAEVVTTINSMKSTTPGTDGIPAAILQLLLKEMISALTMLFNHCLEGGDLPALWREAAVTLIYKDGDMACPGNYCLIALLQVQYKVYTSILAARLSKAFDKEILDIHQNGFCP